MNGMFPALEAEYCPNPRGQTDKPPESPGSLKSSVSVTTLSSPDNDKRPCPPTASRGRPDFPWRPRHAGTNGQFAGPCLVAAGHMTAAIRCAPALIEHAAPVAASASPKTPAA